MTSTKRLNSLLSQRYKLHQKIMSAPNSLKRAFYIKEQTKIDKRIDRIRINNSLGKHRFPLPKGIEGKLLRLYYNTITVTEVMDWLKTEWRLRCMERGRG